MGKISNTLDEKLENILYAIDDAAKSFDKFEYGLPVHSDYMMSQMKYIIKEVLELK